MSQTILAISLFFHIIATTVWIGGLFLTLMLVWPEVRRTLADNPALYGLLSRLRRRFAPLTNLALVVLIVTGLTQMSGDPNYDGLMQVTNDWSRIILIKHLLIGAMVVSGALLQFGVAPALERASLLAERGKGDPAEWERLRRREIRLTWANAGLGALVVACSVYAGTI